MGRTPQPPTRPLTGAGGPAGGLAPCGGPRTGRARGAAPPPGPRDAAVQGARPRCPRARRARSARSGCRGCRLPRAGEGGDAPAAGLTQPPASGAAPRAPRRGGTGGGVGRLGARGGRAGRRRSRPPPPPLRRAARLPCTLSRSLAPPHAPERRGERSRAEGPAGARLQGAARAGARGRGRAGAPRSGKRRRRQRSPAAKMLKVTTPSCSASSCSSVTATVAPGPGSLVPDYWVDGSNRDALGDFFEVESELGRYGGAARGPGGGGLGRSGGARTWRSRTSWAPAGASARGALRALAICGSSSPEYRGWPPGPWVLPGPGERPGPFTSEPASPRAPRPVQLRAAARVLPTAAASPAAASVGDSSTARGPCLPKRRLRSRL